MSSRKPLGLVISSPGAGSFGSRRPVRACFGRGRKSRQSSRSRAAAALSASICYHCRHSYRGIWTVRVSLPELPVPDPAATGQTTARISDRFRHFFLELAERQDREQPQRPDLYVNRSRRAARPLPKPRRIRAYAQASKPSIAEIDLSVWRPDHEVVDRREIETAAARFIEDMKASAKSLDAAVAYAKLIDFAPDFLREYSTRAGLPVNRYWQGRPFAGQASPGRIGERSPSWGPFACAKTWRGSCRLSTTACMESRSFRKL